VTTKLDLPLQPIRELCNRYEVEELSLFGSAVRDDFRDDSDLDFLVVYKPDAVVGFLEFESLRLDLEGFCHRRVDLVSKRGLKARIRDRILSEAKVIYAG
jgi:predicted nucleotidyltransferase